jgi:hypothetical protein
MFSGVLSLVLITFSGILVAGVNRRRYEAALSGAEIEAGRMARKPEKKEKEEASGGQ